MPYISLSTLTLETDMPLAGTFEAKSMKLTSGISSLGNKASKPGWLSNSPSVSLIPLHLN